MNEDYLDGTAKAIPMSQLVNESIGRNAAAIQVQTAGMSQEAPLPVVSGSSTSVLRGNIVVG